MGREIMDQDTTNELFLQDLVRTAASCGAADPGPDPTWDPDEWPEEGVRRHPNHYDLA